MFLVKMETRDEENIYGDYEIFLRPLVPEIRARKVDYSLKNRKNDTPAVLMLWFCQKSSKWDAAAWHSYGKHAPQKMCQISSRYDAVKGENGHFSQKMG